MKCTQFLSCAAISIARTTVDGIDTDTNKLGETKECHCDNPNNNTPCIVDGYVGSKVIYEDEIVRIWNFTLAPGEMTSMHRHDYDYHFIAIKPTQLEVYGQDGARLFDFRAEGVMGFKVSGDYLVPQNIELPWKVPRVHSAKNIGDDDYYEILFESKQRMFGNMGSIINKFLGWEL